MIDGGVHREWVLEGEGEWTVLGPRKRFSLSFYYARDHIRRELERVLENNFINPSLRNTMREDLT